MSALVDTLDKIVNHSGLNLLVSLFLLTCGVSETIKGLDHAFSLGVHHGVIVFGLIHTLKSLSAILKVSKAAKAA
ncbi:hypothetical protein ACFL12_05900 [Pseudomonadota bacterium]